MAVMHNHEVMTWVEDFMAEGYTRAEAVRLARKELENRKTTQAKSSVTYAESNRASSRHKNKLPPFLRGA